MQSNGFEHPALTGKYTILGTLGHGSQGQMLLAQRVADGQKCAIKTYNLKTIPNWKASDLMEREIEVLRTLNVYHVPKCLDIIDASSDERPFYFIVQEYIDGLSLMQHLEQNHRFTLESVLCIMEDICVILLELKNMQIIHRDIKPSNIMIDSTGHAWLVDFGSVVKTVKHEGGSTVAGTAGYMAPEQGIGDALPVSDVYGLGMTMIHVITGRAPFEFDQQDLRPMFREGLSRDIPAWFVQLLDQMIEPFALKRITAGDVLKQLRSGNIHGQSWTDAEKTYNQSKTETESTKDTEIKKPFTIHPDIILIVFSQISIITVFYILFKDKFSHILTIYLMVLMTPLLSKLQIGRNRGFFSRDDD